MIAYTAPIPALSSRQNLEIDQITCDKSEILEGQSRVIPIFGDQHLITYVFEM